MDNVTSLRPIRAYPIGVEFEYGDREMEIVKLQRDIYIDSRDRVFWIWAALGSTAAAWVFILSVIWWLL